MLFASMEQSQLQSLQSQDATKARYLTAMKATCKVLELDHDKLRKSLLHSQS